MSDTDFRLDATNHYAVLELRRPIGDSLREGLAKAAATKDLRALLIIASAEALEAPSPEPDALPRALEQDCNPLMRQLRALPFPVICAVGGYATGLVAGIALACDVVSATHRAAFNFSFTAGTSLPGCGSTYLLPRIVGLARATGMLLLRDKVTADEAERHGLIWASVADDRLLDEGHAIAKFFASQPPRTMTAIKRAMQESMSNEFDVQLELEALMHRELGKGA